MLEIQINVERKNNTSCTFPCAMRCAKITLEKIISIMYQKISHCNHFSNVNIPFACNTKKESKDAITAQAICMSPINLIFFNIQKSSLKNQLKSSNVAKVYRFRQGQRDFLIIPVIVRKSNLAGIFPDCRNAECVLIGCLTRFFVRYGF